MDLMGKEELGLELVAGVAAPEDHVITIGSHKTAIVGQFHL
jgi:hypothetical protein